MKIKQLIILITTLLTISSMSYSETDNSWELTWSDEFDSQ